MSAQFDESVFPTPSRENALLGVACAFLSVTWVVVSLRFWVRALVIKSFGRDDWAMIATQIIYTAYCSMMILIATDRATGLEINEHFLDVLDKLMGYIIASMGLYILAMTALKISLGFFFLRIIIERWQYWIVWITVGVSTVYGIFYFFLAIFQCGDPTKFFQHELEGKCIGREELAGINYAAGALNALTDITLAIMPIFILRKAQMPMAAKISAGGILALGGVGAIISLVRLKYIGGLAPGPDFFVNAIDISIWSVIEPGIGITAASLATLRPLFRGCMTAARTALTTSVTSKKASHNTSDGSDSRGHGRHSPAPATAMDFQDRGMDLESRPRQCELQTTITGNARAMEKMGVAREDVRPHFPPDRIEPFEQVPSAASRRLQRLSASLPNVWTPKRCGSAPQRNTSQRRLVTNEQGVRMAKLQRRQDGKFEVVSPTATDRDGDWL